MGYNNQVPILCYYSIMLLYIIMIIIKNYIVYVLVKYYTDSVARAICLERYSEGRYTRVCI